MTLILVGVILAAALTVALITWAGGGTLNPLWLVVGMAAAALLRLWPGRKP